MESNPSTHSDLVVKDSQSWKAKHAFARAFYANLHVSMVDLWNRINGEKDLRPSVWTDFVEHPDLWKMVYDKLTTMSHITINMCANFEAPEDGMEAIALEDREVYFLVPLLHASVPVPKESGILETLMGDGEKYLACQQLLKTMLMYFFADVYGKEFLVCFKTHEDMTVDRNTINQPFFLKPDGGKS